MAWRIQRLAGVQGCTSTARYLACMMPVLQSPANPAFIFSRLFESFINRQNARHPPLLAYRIYNIFRESISHVINYCTSPLTDQGYTPRPARTIPESGQHSLRKVVSKQIVSTSGKRYGSTFDCDNFFGENLSFKNSCTLSGSSPQSSEIILTTTPQ